MAPKAVWTSQRQATRASADVGLEMKVCSMSVEKTLGGSYGSDAAMQQKRPSRGVCEFCG
jgi:hypothetical protein